MREIVLDTETTGLDPASGHRIVEIGAVELMDLMPTGATFHVYINPERDVPAEATNVHGLTREFLSKHNPFNMIAREFLDFIGNDRLVIHNAEFDMRFLNAELARLELPVLPPQRALDTLLLARRRHPGASNSLDALCGRYGIDLSRRKFHGALLDSQLLAEVYLELSGGRQSALTLVAMQTRKIAVTLEPVSARTEPLALARTEAETVAHNALVASLGEKSIWARYL